MASSGSDGPATDLSRHPRRGSTPNEEGLAAIGAMIERNREGPKRGRSGRRAGPGPGPGPGTRDASRAFDEGGLLELGDEISRTGRRAARRRKTRRRRAKRVAVTLAVVLVVLVGGVAGYGWYLNHEIHRIDVRGLTAAPTSGADAGTENILMVGSTTRCGLAQQNKAYGLCSQGVTGVNSDVIMILHLNPSTHALSILSIPRDLFVPNARTTGANKIDAALYDGPSQLVAVIKQDFGIPIQHYVVLNFDTFANVVDALGGINMYFPMPVYDAYSGLKQLTTGCVHLDGFHALQVVRARHLQYKGPGVTTSDYRYWPQEAQSDLARIRRDHEFLRVLATAVSRQGLGNPVTDTKLVSAVAPNLQVDSQFSTSQMIDLILNFHGVNANSAPQYTLPVAVGTFGSYLYRGGNYGDVEFTSAAQDFQTIDKFLGISPTTNTATGAQLPSPSSVTVSVENGTGAYNQATDTANALQALGFHTVGVGDVPSVGAERETVVYYGQKSQTVEAAAQAVARSLSGSVVMAYGPQEVTDGAQVTVVTGTQFSVNAPAAPAGPAAGAGTSGSAPAPTTTTTTAGSSGSASFAPPSPSQSPLQPWDPRSCTASGHEGP